MFKIETSAPIICENTMVNSRASRQRRIALLALSCLIHQEIAPKIAAKIKSESFLMGGGRTEKQGYVAKAVPQVCMNCRHFKSDIANYNGWD